MPWYCAFFWCVSLYEIINKLHLAPRSLFVRHFHWANNSETDKNNLFVAGAHIFIVNITCCGNHFNASRCTKLPPSETQGCGTRTVLKNHWKREKTDNCLAKLNQAHKPPTVQNGWLRGRQADLWDPVRQPLFFPGFVAVLVVAVVYRFHKFYE